MSDSLKVKKLGSIGNSESLHDGIKQRQVNDKPNAGYLIPNTSDASPSFSPID